MEIIVSNQIFLNVLTFSCQSIDYASLTSTGLLMYLSFLHLPSRKRGKKDAIQQSSQKLIKSVFYIVLPEMCGIKYHIGTNKLSKKKISVIAYYSSNLNKERKTIFVKMPILSKMIFKFGTILEKARKIQAEE